VPDGVIFIVNSAKRTLQSNDAIFMPFSQKQAGYFKYYEKIVSITSTQ